MKLEWMRDKQAHALFWAVLDSKTLKFLESSPRPTILDVGGDDGSLTAPLAERGGRVVVLDINRDALRLVPSEANPVRADVRRLPFKDRVFDGAAARATLHHVPDDLREALAEISRVLRPEGLLLLQEPLAGNPVYAMARRLFPTTWHDVNERPLSWEEYQRSVQDYWDLSEVSPHFLLTYAVPFIVPRVRISMFASEKALRHFDEFDRRLLRALPGLSKYAAYIHIFGRKRVAAT